jgi:hypothetical protein
LDEAIREKCNAAIEAQEAPAKPPEGIMKKILIYFFKEME